MKRQLNEFTELPRRHARINPTGKPTKYWVAVDEYSDSLNQYSKYVMPNLQLKDVDRNAIPSTTVDKHTAVQLAKRAIAKWPTWHVFVGQDKTSHGMMTGKDHLRASVLYIWDPVVKMWNDNIEESKKFTQPTNESLSETELSESTSNEDIVNTAISTLLYFLVGEGRKVLKDDEWMQYLENDIYQAISSGLFKPQFEDKQRLKKFLEMRHPETTDELVDSESENNGDED